jgi:hypothetical protein
LQRSGGRLAAVRWFSKYPMTVSYPGLVRFSTNEANKLLIYLYLKKRRNQIPCFADQRSAVNLIDGESRSPASRQEKSLIPLPDEDRKDPSTAPPNGAGNCGFPQKILLTRDDYTMGSRQSLGITWLLRSVFRKIRAGIAV